ncbi:MAG: tetratricopeptide repeat protein [Anaerolineales bacterium]|nr:tetratricopeptide repeat protein [Anaerolineales bacterium]
MDILTPQQLIKSGTEAFQKGNFKEAGEYFRSAAEGFEQQTDHLMQAEALNNQSVALLQNNEPQKALEIVQGTEKVFEDAGDKKRQAMALGNMAAALEAMKRLEEAEQYYVQSSVIFKEIGEHDLRMEIQRSISALQLKQGRQLEALASMQIGVDNLERPNAKQKLLKKILKIPQNYLNR